MADIHYYPEKTAIKLENDCESLVKIVEGHVGGGKSTMCCMAFFKVMREVPVCADGIRRAKGLILRNTYSELELTTLATWLQWFPEDMFGRLYRKSPFHHVMRFRDDKDVICEFDVYFVSMDKPDDLKKVLSLELTVFYFNEVREVSRSVIVGLITRLTGRYPSKTMLGLPEEYEGKLYYQCLIADTNAPNIRHWLKDVEDNPPTGWKFFRQPPAMIPALEEQEPDVVNGLGRWVINPERENKKGSTAYGIANMARSLDDERFKVDVLSQYGSSFDGKPVHPEYNSSMHFSRDVLAPVSGCPIYLGWDFGSTPAVVVWQLVGGALNLIDNWQAEWSDIGTFVDSVFMPIWITKYNEWHTKGNYISTGDPAGKSITTHEIRTLNDRGIKTYPGQTNDPATRRAALTQWLNRNVNGKPAVKISSHCDFMNEAYAGGYMYKRINVFSNGNVKFHAVPEKNDYSHSAEAGEYALLPLYNDSQKKSELNLNPVSKYNGIVEYAWGINNGTL